MYQVYVRGMKIQITISPFPTKMKHYSVLLLFLLFTVNEPVVINHDQILRCVVSLALIGTWSSIVLLHA